MENRKYAEAILPVIAKQAKTIEQIAKKLGKTKATITTYINDCRNRGHDIEKIKRDGVFLFRYINKNAAAQNAALLKFEGNKSPDHIDNRVKGKTKFIAKAQTDKLGFSVTEQQAVLYGLHLADKALNPEEFSD